MKLSITSHTKASSYLEQDPDLCPRRYKSMGVGAHTHMLLQQPGPMGEGTRPRSHTLKWMSVSPVCHG